MFPSPLTKSGGHPSRGDGMACACLRRPNASIVERYVRKGTQLYVEGYLRTREYEDRMKIIRKRTEIIVERFEILSRKQ